MNDWLERRFTMFGMDLKSGTVLARPMRFNAGMKISTSKGSQRKSGHPGSTAPKLQKSKRR
jgi:hypothetical protein